MSEFFEKYAVALILLAIGVMYIIINLTAVRASKKEGRFISGIPLLGGIHIFIAFLLTPLKWLCVLCLLDYTIPMFFAAFVPGLMSYLREWARFQRVFSRYSCKGTEEKTALVMTFGENDYTREEALAYKKIHAFTDSPVRLAVCKNKNGEMIAAFLRDKGSRTPETVSFVDGRAIIEGVKYKDKGTVLKLTVKNE